MEIMIGLSRSNMMQRILGKARKTLLKKSSGAARQPINQSGQKRIVKRRIYEN